MVICLLEGLRTAFQKQINFQNVREIAQGVKENPALFQDQLVEAIKKHTNMDPDSTEGAAVLSTYFINQSAPDIRRKLQKLAMGLQTPQAKLLEMAFGVFNNRGLVAAEERE